MFRVVFILLLVSWSAFGATNANVVLTWSATTTGAWVTDAEMDASVFGPGTSTAPANSTWLSYTNWPYRFPNWYQIDGTNIDKANVKWLQWTPTNTMSGGRRLQYFAPGGSGGTYTNGWMQGFFVIGITNPTFSTENYDLAEMNGGGFCIMQLGTVASLPTGLQVYAHAQTNGGGSTLGLGDICEDSGRRLRVCN